MRLGSLIVGGAFAAALSVGLACGSDAPTALVVAATTQMNVRGVSAVRVVARTAGGSVCATKRVTSPDDLPLLVEVPGEADATVEVSVQSFGGGSTVPTDPCALDPEAKGSIVRRARTRFVAGERLHLGMPLRQSCRDVRCPDDRTCAGGDCVAADVPSRGLVEHENALVSGHTSFCFPTRVCFDDVTPAIPVDADTCTFQLPDEATHPERLNVQILHDDFAREVLDEDPGEGFVRDETHANRFRLAPALCRRLRARKIAALFTGADCPPKSPLNPLCVEGPPEGGPPAEDVLCTDSADLAPTPAAVYALVDRSKSMAAHLGASPLTRLVDLTLRAPALRSTAVGFRFLPADAGECGAPSGAFAKPAVPFAPASDARPAIVSLLGDASQALAGDPPLYLDAVLREASAVKAFAGALDARTRDRRYLLVLANHDLAPHCQPSVGEPAPQAFVDFRDHDVRTSTLLLGAPADADQKGRDVFLDALTVARSGNGPFGDGSYDEAALRTAMAAFLGELGACLYDAPPSLDTSGDLTSVKLSWFDVVTSARVEIDHAPECRAGALGAASGWNLDGERHVRVCGEACNKLRFSHTTSAVYTMQRGFVPPEIPVKWSRTCGR